ncbi:hypothetical protein CYMTET_51450 [Cymbomonas tetramitiformis]|uniref:Uncharacterized protein n=1 Tax=Cymbomonas tetramitiformis TaxID=36881 RepID=A0AAE0BM95_9CHLO|nr:hypothetical protein CYMTET_51450 [Cymbomonas tetramitiformis]
MQTMLVEYYSSASDAKSESDLSELDNTNTTTLRPVHLDLGRDDEDLSEDSDDREPSRLEAAFARTRAQPLTNAFDQLKRKRSVQQHAGSELPQQPALAAHERERAPVKKPPSGKKRAGGGVRITKEPKIKPSKRITQFPDQCLRVSAGRLFCGCCKESLSLLKQSVKTHVLSAKHLGAKEKFVLRRRDDEHVRDVLVEYFKEHEDEVTANLDPEVHLYRYRVTEGLLYAGDPISRSDYVHPLLELADIRLTTSQHLKQYIPKIEGMEFETLQAEMKGESIFLQFDGTRRLGEALNTVARWCNKDFELMQRLVQFITLESSPDNVALSSTLLTNLVARASFPEKREFMTAWLILVQNNNNAKKLWQGFTSHAMVGFSSNVRWWSRQEDARVVYCADPLLLEVSFAAGYDGTMNMLTTTYSMEGDRLDEILLVYRRVESLRQFGRTLETDSSNRGILPNVDAVIRRSVEVKVGTILHKKEFPGHGIFKGRVSRIDKTDLAEWVYDITYEDGDSPPRLRASLSGSTGPAGGDVRRSGAKARCTDRLPAR